jgi:hypothetical protein
MFYLIWFGGLAFFLFGLYCWAMGSQKTSPKCPFEDRGIIRRGNPDA